MADLEIQLRLKQLFDDSKNVLFFKYKHKNTQKTGPVLSFPTLQGASAGDSFLGLDLLLCLFYKVLIFIHLFFIISDSKIKKT